MKILAVEFSSEQRGVAVLEQAGPDSVPVLLGQIVEQGGRRALELVEQALQRAKCEREEIDCLVLGLGPGSYTGIRGAIALAQGWQLGRGIKLLGISSVECLAAQAQEQGKRGPVNFIVDAQRQEFYLARYQIDARQCTLVEPLRITSMETVAKLLQAGEAVLGPEATKSFLGAIDLYPAAPVLGRLALGRTDFVSGSELQPIYLRETTFKKAPPPRAIL